MLPPNPAGPRPSHTDRPSETGTADAIHALVLAGRRSGADPLADAAGAPHRALLDIFGTPMLERVIATLERNPRIDRIVVSIDRPELLDAYPGLAARSASGRVEIIRSAETSPATSVLEAIEGCFALPGKEVDGAAQHNRVLLTTADHALLDDAILAAFIAGAEAKAADLAVGMVGESLIARAYPATKRTYLPFRGERYSGANLFLIDVPIGLVAIEFWRHVEQQRKHPLRLASAFGLTNLLLFAAHRLDVDAAMSRASRVIGNHIAAVPLPFAEAAIDVDKIADLELVRQILSERGEA